MSEKVQLYVEQRTYREHGYDHTEVVIRNGRGDKLDALIDQCIDNKVGYMDGNGYKGSETAARMKRRYEWLREQGYAGVFAAPYGAAMRVTLIWQHFGPDQFCEARIVLPEKLEPMQASAKLLGQLVTAINRYGVRSCDIMDDPKYLLSALRRRNAIVIERVTVPASVDANLWNSELCIPPQATRLARIAS